MILSQYLTVTIENMIIPLTTPWFIVPSFASEFPHPRDCSRPSAGASWPSDCLATVRGTHLRISALELFWTRRNIGIDAKHLGLKRLNIHFSRETSKKNTRSGIDYVEQEAMYSSKFKARSRSGWLPTGQEQVVFFVWPRSSSGWLPQ